MKIRSKKFTAIAVLCASMAFANVANARVPKGPALDTQSAGCKILQNESDSLLSEFAGPKTGARADEILARLRAIALDWNQICRGAFGSIVSKKIPRAVRDALGPQLSGPDATKLK